MEQPQLFEAFTERLNYGKFSYIISGSVASIYYGLPRLTHDIDIVCDLSRERIREFVDLFNEKEFYIPPEETLLAEISRPNRGHFNLINLTSGFKADIYITGTDKLHRWAVDNRKEAKVGRQVIFIAPPEYVIIRKLEYYREGRSDKHLEDIRNMIQISRELIDMVFLENEIRERGLTDYWKGAKKEDK